MDEGGRTHPVSVRGKEGRLVGSFRLMWSGSPTAAALAAQAGLGLLATVGDTLRERVELTLEYPASRKVF